jgi:hypothetical protein
MIQDIVSSGLNLQHCPKCQREIGENFNYCPNCGFHLTTTTTPYPVHELVRLFGSVEMDEARIHFLAQKRLGEIGSQYGLQTIFGYSVSPSDASEWSHQIDVVWVSDDKVVAGFEIEPKMRDLEVVSREDIQKLGKLDAQTKFIVNVSKISGKAYFHRLEDTKLEDTRVEVTFDATALAGLFGSVDAGGKRGQVHWLARERLQEIGTKYGLRTAFQYYESGTARYPRQLTVVLWLSDSKIVAAFEIVPKLRNLSAVTNRYDVEKLADTDAQDKFIVNVSRVTGKGYFHRLRENGTIECAPVSEEVYSYKLEDIKKIYPRAYDVWTQEEDNALIKEYKEGISVSKLAEMHQRKIGAIRSRLAKLGLLPK